MAKKQALIRVYHETKLILDDMSKQTGLSIPKVLHLAIDSAKREGVKKEAKQFEQELKLRPASPDELWLALHLMTDAYTSYDSNHLAPYFVKQARAVMDSMDGPTIPFEEVLKKHKI